MSQHDYYERYWSDEGYQPLRGDTPPHLRRLFERHVRAEDHCLDLGCGDGGTSGLYLSSHAASYLGVDVSGRAVELARSRGLDARRIEDAGALPFSDGSFDVVVCVEVLEHLYEPQRAAAEALRVLRPGGRLIATVPNAAYWRDRLDAALGQWQPGGDDRSRAEPWRSPHVRFFRPSTLERMLVDVGFVQVETIGVPAPLLGRVPLLRRFVDEPGRPSGAAARLWPSLLAGGIAAVASRA